MRLHITYQGKKTTISVSDQLIDYLGAFLVYGKPEWYAKGKIQHEMAVSRIRNLVTEASNDGCLPTKNLSQYVQSRIIGWIAEPFIVDVLEVRGPRPEKRKASTYHAAQHGSKEDSDAAYESLKNMLGPGRKPRK